MMKLRHAPPESGQGHALRNVVPELASGIFADGSANETNRPVFVHKILQLVNTRSRVLGLQGLGLPVCAGLAAHMAKTRVHLRRFEWASARRAQRIRPKCACTLDANARAPETQSARAP